MTAQDHPAWVRLGEMLEVRRVQIDPQYKNLRLFCEEAQIDYRLAGDVEHARRTNYQRPTITSIEVAYGWKPGSIRAVLAGGEPQETEINMERRRQLRAARRGLRARQQEPGSGAGGLTSV